MWFRKETQSPSWFRNLQVVVRLVGYNHVHTKLHGYDINLKRPLRIIIVYYHDRKNHHIMSAPYTGSCLCGSVRLNITSEPVAVLSCFCEHCTKGAGGTHQLVGHIIYKQVYISQSLMKY